MRSDRRAFIAGALALPLAAWAQPRLYRIGVIYNGGPYTAAIDGLRDGLKDLGIAEGRNYVFHFRNVRGDLSAVEGAARSLELEKVDLIYSVATTTTVRVKRATKTVPIVFYAGTDPVGSGLIASYAKPGGRLTGIHSQFTDLTAKRLELLKALVPSVQRPIAFFLAAGVGSQQSIKLARAASERLKLTVLERPVASPEELRTALRALRPGDADAIFYLADALSISNAELIIETATALKIPVMLAEETSVAKGALASYGVSYYVCGRLAAKLVQRVMQGANPGDLPIEQIDTPHFVINLKAASMLGITIPQSLLARADEVIR
jgi:putative ABC transport system substrate-binding protein